MTKLSLLDRLLGRNAPGDSKHGTRSTLSASPTKPARFNRLQGASGVNERNVTQGTNWNAVYRDRYDYDRSKVLEEALLAWRLNPLCRRIVEIQTQYTTDGIEFQCDDPKTEQFLKEFWNHRLNKIGEHLKEWADELAITGNLFPILTTPSYAGRTADRAGMSYLRIFPTDMIESVKTADNDVQQEQAYIPKATANDPDPQPIPNAFNVRTSKRSTPLVSPVTHERAGSNVRTVMLHYAVNRLAGMVWGEPDIAPLLPWLARYASWLEDRVRLNRFRQAYLYVVKGNYASQQEKDARQIALQNNPPQPGSILVTDSSEEWSVLDPKLDSFEANNDGLALKKFIAGGRGLPLHWLSEPESSTRTTAEAAGTPTFKGLESRQQFFLSMLKDILEVVASRAGLSGNITVTAADISERDNAALALASSQVVTAFGQMWANGFIDDDEYMRVVYRFAGEVLPSARPDNPRPRPIAQAAPAPAAPGDQNLKIEPETGEVKVKEPRS